MALDCIPKTLSHAFYLYGKFIGRHPLPFLIIPIIVALGLIAGMINMESTSDPEYLYAPTGARSKDERSYFRNHYRENDDEFSALRVTEFRGFLQIILEDKNDADVLNSDAVNSISEINDFVLSFRAKYKNDRYNYSQLCTSFQGNCVYSAFIEILQDAGDVIENIDISYPFHSLSTNRTLNLIQVIGDPDLDSNNVVQAARTVQLVYFVRFDDDTDEERSTAWLDGIRDELLDYKDPIVDVVFQTSLTLEQELEDSVSSIIPLFSIAYNILAIFAIVTCLMFDWVRAKPWVALAGMVAAGLGIISSMGLMAAAGVTSASVIGTMPFLIIGIGVDDMFIMVSAWRYTSFKHTTEERTGEMLRSAAVSITITSVTDALAFGIGCLTPFRSVTIFCAYTGVAICFVYIYMITFTTACMVYSGRREEANRHPFACCIQVLPKKKAVSENKSRGYQICCAGGSYEPQTNDIPLGEPVKKEPLPPIGSHTTTEEEEDPLLAQGIQLPWMNKFLGSTYADFILSIPMKIIIFVCYCGLIAGAIYGITELKEGLDRANLAPDGSYFTDYFDKFVRDFSGNYGPMIMVSFDEPLDYHLASVRNDINELVQEFRENKYFVDDEHFVVSWLVDFGRHSNFSAINSLSDFITTLRDDFLPEPASQYYNLDINFNNDFSAIESSRIFIQSQALNDAIDEREMMLAAREIADDSNMKVEVFTPEFIFFDQYVVIAINTLQNLGIAVASMMVVSLILIPSITTVIWVTVATISICTCIVGYMALWDVSLDSVSMINLVMCIGFSVDFAAHISYHFVISESRDPNQCAKDALGYLGTPIVQGFVSTLLAVMALSTANTYIFRTFFKLVFLVMVFGFFHAMFLLPVLLSTLSCRRCSKRGDDTERSVSPTRTATAVSIDVGKNNGHSYP